MLVNTGELRDELRDRIRAQGRGSQTRIAERIGVERQYLNHMLSGRSPMPLDRLQQIMDALEIELEVIPKKELHDEPE